MEAALSNVTIRYDLMLTRRELWQVSSVPGTGAGTPSELGYRLEERERERWQEEEPDGQ